MRTPLLLCAILLLSLLAGCVLPETMTLVGSGDIVVWEENFSDFNKVDVSNAFAATIVQGESYRIRISADSNLAEHVSVTRAGSTLRVGLEPGRMFSIRSGQLRAEITLPELVGLQASGASQVSVDGFESEQGLTVDLSGASQLRGTIDAGDVRVDVSGASSLNLLGHCQNLNVDASGASSVDLTGLACMDADVTASGASRATVNPSGSLNADASGASTIHYAGNPTLGNIETSGASTVGPR